MRYIYCLMLIAAFCAASFGQKTRAENFSAVDLNGNAVELSALKGKVVVVTFWSTRCPICHHEIPKLNALAARYKNENVAFIGFTTDNQAKVESYIKKSPFYFQLVPNSFGTLLQYAEKDSRGNIKMGYPAHFLINQNGEIELRSSGFDRTEELNSNISRLLTRR